MAKSRDSVTTALDLGGCGLLFVSLGVWVAAAVGGVTGVAAGLGVVGALVLGLSLLVAKVGR